MSSSHFFPEIIFPFWMQIEDWALNTQNDFTLGKEIHAELLMPVQEGVGDQCPKNYACTTNYPLGALTKLKA